MKQNIAKKFKRLLTVLISATLVLGVVIGSSLALLIDSEEAVVNTFVPSQVTTAVSEELNGSAKESVKITNTGDIDANIRAAIVVTWQDAKGNVYGQKPVAGTDYTMLLDLENGWTKNEADGFYYWNAPVAPGANTGVLITSCTAANTAPEGYSLCVEIIGSGIQAVGIPEGSHPWFD